MYSVEGVAFGLNYGYDKVRFPAPLPVGSQVRMRATLTAVDDVPGGVQVTVTQTFEREGGDKPVCVAESLARFYTAAESPLAPPGRCRAACARRPAPRARLPAARAASGPRHALRHPAARGRLAARRSSRPTTTACTS